MSLVSVSLPKHLRKYVSALIAAVIVAAVMVAASASAQAARPSTNSAHAAAYDDGYCDWWDDLEDPDCMDDTDDGSGLDPVEDPPYVPDPSLPTAPTGPTGPVKPPVVQWPAPPKGAYARISSDGRKATIPKGTPAPVKKMIRAANSITRKPYVWGGGHGRWYDRGYDCSGATSFVLRAGGLLSYPMVSGTLSRWGKSGRGNWVTIYAHKNHVFMVIAGLRFDTSSMGAGGGKGPRWRGTVRSTSGFKVRHPAGF